MVEFSDPVVTIQELHQQGISYHSFMTELTFQGRQFKRYLSFRKLLLKAGIDYCKKALGRGELCFLVSEESSFTIWRATQQLKSAEIHSMSLANTTDSVQVQATSSQASPQRSNPESPQQRMLAGAGLPDAESTLPVNLKESPSPVSSADSPQQQFKSPDSQFKRIYRGIAY